MAIRKENIAFFVKYTFLSLFTNTYSFSYYILLTCDLGIIVCRNLQTELSEKLEYSLMAMFI